MQTKSQENFKKFFLKKVIKENHQGNVIRIKFHPSKENQNVVATIGENQLNIYDNDHLGGNNLDIMCNFVNEETKISKGSKLTTFCWIGSFIAVGTKEGIVQLLSVLDNRVVAIYKGNGKPILDVSTFRHYLASSTSNSIKIWNLVDHTVFVNIDIDGCNSLVYEGEKIYSGHQNGAVRVIQINEKGTKIDDSTLIYKYQNAIDHIRKMGNYIFFKSRGMILIGRLENDSSSLKLIDEISMSQESGLFDLLQTKEGDIFICFGNSESNINIYKFNETTKSTLFHTLEQDKAHVNFYSCVFAPDCKSILGVSDDGNVWKWKWFSPEEIEKHEKFLEKNKETVEEEKDEEEEKEEAIEEDKKEETIEE